MIAEWDAAKALLEANGLAGRVKDSTLDGNGDPVRATYVVLYGGRPDEVDDARYGVIPRPDSDAEYEFAVRAVSTDAGGVRELAKLINSVRGQKPVIVGRRADPVSLEFENPKVDNAVSPPLYFQDVWLRFGSRRA